MSIICLDFETFYAPGYGLRALTTEEYIRHPWFQVIGFAYKIGAEPAVWVTGTDEYMAQVLAGLPWESSALCAHNCRFDAAILNWRFGLRPRKYIDTMSLARGLVGLATSCSLEKLGQYFNLPIQKGHEVVKALGLRRDDFPPDQLREYGEYCKNDTEMSYLLAELLIPRTLPGELQLQDWTIRAFAEPKLVLDEAVLREELAAFQQRRAGAMARCGVSDISVLRSDDAMANALLRRGIDPPVKLSPKQKNPDGSPKLVWAFSKQDVEFMDLLDHEDEDVVALVEARIGAKSSIVETRLQRLIGVSRRGAMPMPMMYAGATPTRRWSGDDNINVQNFPRNKLKKDADGNVVLDADGNPVIDYSPLRRAICAPPGFRMAAADLSQIELRVNAWQSGQHDVLDILRNGGDVYSDQATALYGYTITKKSGKTVHQVERFVGKTTELQCGYQCGWEKFLHSLKVAAKRDGMTLPDTSPEFGRRIVDGYRQKRVKIKAFWYAANEALQAMAYGMRHQLGPYEIHDYRLWLPNGSYLYYPNLRLVEKKGPTEIGTEWVYDRYRKGRMETTKMYGGKFVENITQAHARLFVSDALLRLETLKWPDGSRVFEAVFMVHDELVVLFPEHLSDDYVKQCLTWAMTTPATWAPDLPLDCEIGIANNYGGCK